MSLRKIYRLGKLMLCPLSFTPLTMNDCIFLRLKSSKIHSLLQAQMREYSRYVFKSEDNPIENTSKDYLIWNIQIFEFKQLTILLCVCYSELNGKFLLKWYKNQVQRFLSGNDNAAGNLLQPSNALSCPQSSPGHLAISPPVLKKQPRAVFESHIHHSLLRIYSSIYSTTNLPSTT